MVHFYESLIQVIRVWRGPLFIFFGQTCMGFSIVVIMLISLWFMWCWLFYNQIYPK